MRPFILFLCLAPTFVTAQQALRVLFLGNSYTASNNLPSLVAQMAQSGGDNIQTEDNLPGGYTFELHAGDPTSLQKIAQGNWDYVVMQGQSQRPAFPESQVQSYVYPYARKLDSLIKASNPCGRTMFFRTWGRKNGDASNCQYFAPLCTYEGMDSMLALRYRQMANDNGALLCPAGALWKAIRKDRPSLELYEPDESHPSAAGSYVAACAFYTMLLGKNPDSVSYNYVLPDTLAAYIRHMAKQVVYDSLSHWNYYTGLPVAAGGFIQNNRHVQFYDSSQNATAILWDFGGGGTSHLPDPTVDFDPAGPNQVRVMLVASWCNYTDTTYFDLQFDTTTSTGCNTPEPQLEAVYPNPVQRGQILNLSSRKQYTLYDQKLVKLLRCKDGRLETIGLRPGLYFLMTENQQEIIRILVQP